MADRREADDLLVVALAAGQTVTAAAASAGVGVKTARRRMKEDGFRNRVRRARAEMLTEATGRMVSGLGAAVLVLQQLLVDDDPGIRLKAADKLLAHTFKAAELVDLADRVAELEKAAGGGADDDLDPDDDDAEGDPDGSAEEPG